MHRYAVILVALTLCAGAARAQKVKVDWDRATDFAPYKTYKWKAIPTPRTPTPEMEKQIHSSADAQLQAKGLKKIENGEPDLYVGYSITLAQPKKQAPAASPSDSSSWQAGSSWSANSSSGEASRKATLNLDIADAKRNVLIWRGAVAAEVGDSVNDAKFKIRNGLSTAFAKFPPPPK
jgi:hypothetical protein